MNEHRCMRDIPATDVVDDRRARTARSTRADNRTASRLARIEVKPERDRLRQSPGFRFEAEFLQHPLRGPCRPIATACRRIAHQRLQRGDQRIGIAGRHQHAGHAVFDHQFGRACARRDQRRARRHRLDQRQAKAFVARGEGVDRQALVPALHFLDRQFAGDDDARQQARGLDPLLQIVGKAGLLRHDGADHDGGEIGIARQQPAHRIDKDIAALLRADPAEAADRVASRQSAFGERRGAIRRRRVDVGVDAMRDHGRFALQIGRRDIRWSR